MTRGAHFSTALLGIFVLSLTSLATAQAQRLVADVSREIVELRYDFAGTELLLFGAVKGSVGRGEQLDIVASIMGPLEPVVVRRKTQVAGLWLNTDSLRIRAAPGFYALATSRPLDELTSADVLARLGLGPAHMSIDIGEGRSASDRAQFRDGFFRRMQNAGLYRVYPEGLRIAEDTLFRATIELPANVPAGIFEAQVYLFVDGRLSDRRKLEINVDKTGFERSLFNFAHSYPFLYGLSAVIVALVAGWVAGFAARR